MGLIKRNGYNVKGVELETAYAKINRLYIEKGNLARTYFGISNSRENINEGNSLEEIEFRCYVDKNEAIYEQIYVEAKKNIFVGWEDDIVVEESIVEEDTPATLPVEELIEAEIPTEKEEENEIDILPIEEKIEIEIPEDNDELDEVTQNAIEEPNAERSVW